MSTLSDTYFPAAYAVDPGRPVEDVERDRDMANRVGRLEVMTLLRAGRPGLAYRRLVETVEHELAIVGHPGVRIPAMDGLRRLSDAKRAAKAGA